MRARCATSRDCGAGQRCIDGRCVDPADAGEHGDSFDAAEVAPVRQACGAHLRDEIGHARVGRAHLASGALDASDRRAIARWMPRLVRANGRAWLARLATLLHEGVPGHGYPPVRELAAGVIEALREIVLPGLAEVGIDASAAAREVATPG